jgi:hypothetical protein
MHVTDFRISVNVTLVTEFDGTVVFFTMGRNINIAPISSPLSQGLTKRSASLSEGSCHSDLASESVSSILDIKLKLRRE